MNNRLSAWMAGVAVLFCALLMVSTVRAGEAPPKKDVGSTPVTQNANAEAMRVQGELRFHANCGRCHAAPEKFPPRMMATVVRHMRVRATITDQDMKLVLFYMTQ